MEPVSLDILETRLSPAQMGQGNNAGPDDQVFTTPPSWLWPLHMKPLKSLRLLKQRAWFRRGWKPTGRESFVLKMQIAFHLMDSFLFRRLTKWIVRPRCLIFSHTLLDAQTENEGWWVGEVGDFPREKEKTSDITSLKIGQFLLLIFFCLLIFYLFWKF